ncbi:TetR/AcrR family transcriptional regulator [Actinoplanes teichomyceticus]|uniref:TetR/AcrR family transcriptional regulator n=1 Tax=Actinoplanes teichomyceticus TaxID=1867 RepID=UPI00194226D0|nr:helix-turn-helix domain-containing protein [Actinoplanes teichomyceticus]
MTLRADSARVRTRMLAAARARVDAGDLELPMNAIAKDAGVGVGTMYRHFATRRALLEALATESLRELAYEAGAAATSPDIGAGLAALIKATLRRQLSDPALAGVLASGDVECADTRGLLAELMAAAQRVLARARAEGAIRADVTPDDLRRLTCGIRYAVTSGDDEDGTALDRYLEILMRGLHP